jgi:cell division protein FtsB
MQIIKDLKDEIERLKKENEQLKREAKSYESKE